MKILSTPARAPPGPRSSRFSTDTQCSPSAKFPTPRFKTSTLKLKRQTRPISSSELPIAVSASSTPRVPARSLPSCRRSRHRLRRSLRRGHLPAARQYYSPAKISSRAPKLNLVSRSHRPPPSVPRRFRSPLRQALRTLLTPPGTPGQADINVSSAAGTTTSARAFQYLQSVQVFAKPALYKFVLYDQKRQWLYLSNTDHVDVFDLSAAQFRATGINPPGGPPPNAAIRGLSLTPDASQLVVADFGAQSVYLLNPDAGTGTTVPVGGVAGFLNSGPARVAATSTQTVFVAMSGEGGSSAACSSCLSQLNLAASPPTVQPAPQPEVTTLTGAPLVQPAANGNTVFLVYDAATGGPVGTWSAGAPNQFTVSVAKEFAVDLAAASDGTAFASRATATEIRRADLTLSATPASPELEQIPTRVLVPGLALHPTGALLYEPFLTGPAPPRLPPPAFKEASIFSMRTPAVSACASSCPSRSPRSPPTPTRSTAAFSPSTKPAEEFSPSPPPASP